MSSKSSTSSSRARSTPTGKRLKVSHHSNSQRSKSRSFLPSQRPKWTKSVAFSTAWKRCLVSLMTPKSPPFWSPYSVVRPAVNSSRTPRVGPPIALSDSSIATHPSRRLGRSYPSSSPRYRAVRLSRPGSEEIRAGA